MNNYAKSQHDPRMGSRRKKKCRPFKIDRRTDRQTNIRSELV